MRNANANENSAEHPVLKNAFKNVELIMNFPGANEIEYLHHSKYVEDISHLSACSILTIVLDPQRSNTIPIILSSRIDIFV